MSLLTPNESHAYSNPFLSHMDYQESHSSHQTMAHSWPNYNTADFIENIEVQGSEDLHRATKDLIASDRWASTSMQSQQLHYNYFPQQTQQQQHHEQHIHYDIQSRQYPQQHPQQPRRNTTFPFLVKQEQPHLHPLSTNIEQQSYNGLPTPTTASSSSNSSYSYQPSPMLTSPVSPTFPVRLSRSPGLSAPPTSNAIKRRSFDSSIISSHKRTRLSPPYSAHPYSRPSASPTPPMSSKPPLLSPDQKKANHIQSEQKRRANIRRGYEALCETVPALAEAIRAEEESLATGKEKGSRSRRGKAKGKEEQAGEKTDGRAGPRSENVVLMKTIDYINELQSERSDLLTRLEQARSRLGAGHPALAQSDSQPALWEREWRGGAGSEGEEEEESE